MSKVWQDLDKLMAFVLVAEKGKINRAADSLHLTQPSITRAIQKLEESFGTALFTRSRNGMKLTRAGELLYEKASKFLRSIEDVRISSQNVGQEITGHLTIGTYESLAEYLWPDFLMSLSKTHPTLHLSIRTNIYQNHLADLIAGKIDLLVDAEPQTKSSVTSWSLYSDKFSFFTSNNFEFSIYTREMVREMNVIFVRDAKDENGLAIEDHLDKEEFEFAREYCFDSFSTAKRLAIRGLGIAILPIKLAEADETRKFIKRVSLKGFGADGFGKHTICATVGVENERDPRIKKIISLLKNRLR